MAHWHLLGLGAIGSLWAHRLKQAGHEVSLLLKDEPQLARYHASGGISLCLPSGLVQHENFNASLGLPPQQLIDNLLVCCKSWQSSEAIAGITSHLGPHSRVVVMQNGLGQLYSLRQPLAHCAYYCASTTDGVYKNGDFTVTLAGQGNTVIGPFNAAAKGRDICLPDANWEDTIEPLLWRKLCVNAVINPLSALYDIRNGKVSELPEVAPLCTEISAIVRAAGHAFSSAEIQQMVLSVAQQTAANSSSMREDMRAKRRTEITEINGYLFELACRYGINAPLNHSLITAIKQK